MSRLSSPHYVIIGSGVAGNHAAELLRDNSPDSRITIITNNQLLFYNRYLLPRIFLGSEDWRDFLAWPASHYNERKIVMRRATWVTSIDPAQRLIMLGHNESIHYDKLLIASGARGYFPEELADYRALIHGFGSYEQAIATKRALPDGGTVVMLGGDMIGLDLARSLIAAGYRVRLVSGEMTFWPHQIADEQRGQFCDAVKAMGIEVIRGDQSGGIRAIEVGASGLPARRVLFHDGSDLYGDVVMSFMGLVPAIEFMISSGLDIERGVLVSTTLQSSDPNIYAAGDVCQIWSPEEQRYRFYYGHHNVRAMGIVAAGNMMGASEPFVSTWNESLRLDQQGYIDSPFWECD
ncbi:MAG: FAD-dependent oxidoreductase [Magnetococcales bacterium]|nr:FAD-dependent oxidoreductase [Magnetococcales bacterium]